MEGFGNEKHRIIFGDALDALTTLPDNAVDLPEKKLAEYFNVDENDLLTIKEASRYKMKLCRDIRDNGDLWQLSLMFQKTLKAKAI
jgi:hypothetical protein